jgi:hypothetical protein
MNNYSITNQTAVLDLFEICLLASGENDQQVILCLAPTPKGEVAAYLRTNGGPSAIGLRTEDGWFFGREAFGGEGSEELLALMAKDGITADAIRSAAKRGESDDVAEVRHSLAEAIEESLAAHEA